MNFALTNPVTVIVALALVRGLLVFVPIATMRFMPESNWFWGGLLAGLLVLITGEIVLAFRRLQGRKCAAVVAGSIGFTVIGLPLIVLAGFMVSLAIGTFEFPPR